MTEEELEQSVLPPGWRKTRALQREWLHWKERALDAEALNETYKQQILLLHDKLAQIKALLP